MAVNKRCVDCGSEMAVVKRTEKSSTVYYYLKCKKCNKEVLRRE